MAPDELPDQVQRPLAHCTRPCTKCPWRRDVASSEFGADRYVDLSCTVGAPGREVPVGGPMFACHLSAEDREKACAGWLAVAGWNHLGVRYAVISGRLDPRALAPGDDWPQLYESYAEMAEANGALVDGEASAEAVVRG